MCGEDENKGVRVLPCVHTFCLISLWTNTRSQSCISSHNGPKATFILMSEGRERRKIHDEGNNSIRRTAMAWHIRVMGEFLAQCLYNKCLIGLRQYDLILCHQNLSIRNCRHSQDSYCFCRMTSPGGDSERVCGNYCLLLQDYILSPSQLSCVTSVRIIVRSFHASYV